MLSPKSPKKRPSITNSFELPRKRLSGATKGFQLQLELGDVEPSTHVINLGRRGTQSVGHAQLPTPPRPSSSRRTQKCKTLHKTLKADCRLGFGLAANVHGRVTTVVAGTAADKAGIMLFDRIIEIDGTRMDGAAGPLAALAHKDEARLIIERPPPSALTEIAAKENAPCSSPWAMRPSESVRGSSASRTSAPAAPVPSPTASPSPRTFNYSHRPPAAPPSRTPLRSKSPRSSRPAVRRPVARVVPTARQSAANAAGAIAAATAAANLPHAARGEQGKEQSTARAERGAERSAARASAPEPRAQALRIVLRLDSGSSEGLGLTVTKRDRPGRGRVFVSHVAPHSAGAAAGLRVGDEILSAGGVEVRGNLAEVLQRPRLRDATQLVLHVRRYAAPERPSEEERRRRTLSPGLALSADL